jgi:hypothetical protein
MPEGDNPILDPGRHALFLDFDGTFVDFAPTPDAVKLRPGSLELLGELQGRLGGALAVISGRRLFDIDGFLRPLELPGSGVHGQEFRPYGGDFRVEPPSPQIQLARERLKSALGPNDPLHLEDKGGALVLHFRLIRSSATGHRRSPRRRWSDWTIFTPWRATRFSRCASTASARPGRCAGSPRCRPSPEGCQFLSATTARTRMVSGPRRDLEATASRSGREKRRPAIACRTSRRSTNGCRRLSAAQIRANLLRAPEPEDRHVPDQNQPRLHLKIILRPGSAIGPGKIDLLEAIAATGSIRAAGARFKMSYKRAWGLVAD